MFLTAWPLPLPLRDVHRCSRISPEIQVAQTPASTDYYDVRLMEFTSDSQEMFLGGGLWNDNGHHS